MAGTSRRELAATAVAGPRKSGKWPFGRRRQPLGKEWQHGSAEGQGHASEGRCWRDFHDGGRTVITTSRLQRRDGGCNGCGECGVLAGIARWGGGQRASLTVVDIFKDQASDEKVRVAFSGRRHLWLRCIFKPTGERWRHRYRLDKTRPDRRRWLGSFGHPDGRNVGALSRRSDADGDVVSTRRRLISSSGRWAAPFRSAFRRGS